MASQDKSSDDYTYRSSGLDDFFTRQTEIGRTPEPVQQMSSAELNFDDLQTGGSLGNTLQVGNLRLNGIDKRLEILNGNGEIIGAVGSLDNL